MCVQVILTTLFAVEYAIRALADRGGVWAYVCSVFGLVDLLAVAPFVVEALVDAEEGKVRRVDGAGAPCCAASGTHTSTAH